MVIVISLQKCNNTIVVKCNELNKSATQSTLDHCILVNNLYMGCRVVTVVKCSVPGILMLCCSVMCQSLGHCTWQPQ